MTVFPVARTNPLPPCGGGLGRGVLKLGILSVYPPDAGLIIELDGGQHGIANTARRDKRRTAWLGTRGYKVLRFWNTDVLQNTEGVLELIAAELEKAPPSLLAARRRADLPRKGGGEESAAQ
ncbi:MAG TPA: DUF559 domain-containing protein [Methyloceanibacter sp.]|nr:DUF559 domain-containing protein [Methyloceanibacter sp.]